MQRRGQRLSLAAFDRRGARNGHVVFGYAGVRSAARGGYAIYGWVLLGYRYEQRPFMRTTTTPRRGHGNHLRIPGGSRRL